MKAIFLLLPGVVTVGLSATESAIAQSIRSPEVHADGAVTFRLNAAEAQQAFVNVSGSKVAMQKDDRGVWKATSEPLPPGIHDYNFNVDGTMMIDPSNRNVKKWLTMASMVEIPGSPPLLTEMQDVPHGVIHRMFYPSKAVGQSRPVMVYTPPDYSSDGQRIYPLVILAHGFGDDETAWTEVGRAHFIADNLMAAGDLAPCIIAMPYGHPVPVPIGDRVPDYGTKNNQLYEQDIMQDLLPFLEARFAVRRDPAGRSIAGLSMGGGHALDTGLKHPDTFSAIGAFSAAVPQLNDQELLEQYPSLKGPGAAADDLRLLYIPIGVGDFLLERNERFVEQLKANKVRHQYNKTDGGHEWKVWRKYLPDFLKMAVGK